jgi:hypothetical protein
LIVRALLRASALPPFAVTFNMYITGCSRTAQYEVGGSRSGNTVGLLVPLHIYRRAETRTDYSIRAVFCTEYVVCGYARMSMDPRGDAC